MPLHKIIKLSLLPIPLCLMISCSQALTTHQRIDGIYETTTEVTLPNHSVSHHVLILSDSQERSKAPVLLLHELPGLSTKTLNYAASLARDFTVYVPILFGSPNQNNLASGLLAYYFNGEWWERDALMGSRQITQWLRHVVKHISHAHPPDQKIGIIGMCLTGALPLALLDNESVQAVVVAQPTLPFLDWSEEDKFDLGLSLEEWDHARTEIDSATGPFVYGVRFQNDTMADRAKHTRMNHVFNQIREHSFIDREICLSEYKKSGLPRKAHSTLIGEWKDIEGHASQKRRQEIRSFLLNPQDFIEDHETTIPCA